MSDIGRFCNWVLKLHGVINIICGRIDREHNHFCVYMMDFANCSAMPEAEKHLWKQSKSACRV